MSAKRVILYARLSITTDESVSIERQYDAGRDYCRAQGWTVVATYKDDGVSASAKAPEDRKGWQQVLSHSPGSYDLVLVWKVDRLARKVLDFLHADQALQERGAAVAAVADPVDMSTAQGRAFATMLAVFAEMEAEAIRARVKEARAALIKAGRVPGGAAPFGYYNAEIASGGKVLSKDPDTIEYVAEAANRVLRGDSLNSVATYLDDVAPRAGRKNSAAYWTTTVTKRMLSNPVLAGMTSHNPGNKGKTRGAEVLRHPSGMPVVRPEIAVLSVEEYRRLLDRLRNKSEPQKARTESYLAGLVWCGHCDRKMYRNAKTVGGRKVRVFQCQGKSGCGQQVTGLEGIVEERFLSQYGDSKFLTLYSTTEEYDKTEVITQINETHARMLEPSVNVMELAERLTALQEVLTSIPEPEYKEQHSWGTSGEQWVVDKREALLGRTAGVRLVKGKVGRTFDQSRLSWIPRGEIWDGKQPLSKFLNIT